jgi:predicted Zn-dependent protease
MNHAAPLTGHYYNGRDAAGVPATLSLEPARARLAWGETQHEYRPQDLRVSPRIARATRFIDFPDGGQLQCADSAALETLPQEKTEAWIAWLESRVAVAVLGIIAILATVIGGYFYGLPRAAEWAAARVPIEVEQSLGAEALSWLDGQGWLQPSKLSDEVQTALRADFDTLRQGLAHESQVRLEFRASPKLGANALALPGGTIVVTDALVKLSNSRREVAAVLAHELGHIEQRHAMRQVLQSSIVILVAATIVGDAATLGVSGVPAVLAQARYSRELESEADEFAFQLLRKHDISPEYFASFMTKMAQSANKGEARQQSNFLSTHPITSERIERARAAARQSGAE